MFGGWENYFLMIGSSAGALIGLMFVVATLTTGRDQEQTERGKHLYTSPIVWNLAVILVLSGAAFAPDITPAFFGMLSGAVAVIGIGMGIRNALVMARMPMVEDTKLFDLTWYGIAPTLTYVGLGASAIGMFMRHGWASAAVAADLMTLLLVSIHAEWDLVTYLAPIAGRRRDDV